jgi:hypothetical protein
MAIPLCLELAPMFNADTPVDEVFGGKSRDYLSLDSCKSSGFFAHTDFRDKDPRLAFAGWKGEKAHIMQQSKAVERAKRSRVVSSHICR